MQVSHWFCILFSLGTATPCDSIQTANVGVLTDSSFSTSAHCRKREWIQRLATRLVTGFRHLLHKEWQRRWGLHSLSRRRLRTSHLLFEPAIHVYRYQYLRQLIQPQLDSTWNCLNLHRNRLTLFLLLLRYTVQRTQVLKKSVCLHHLISGRVPPTKHNITEVASALSMHLFEQ